MLVIVSEAIPAVKNALTRYDPVGPLSGKTLAQVANYVIAWVALAYAWRGKSVAFGRVYAATLILVPPGGCSGRSRSFTRRSPPDRPRRAYPLGLD